MNRLLCLLPLSLLLSTACNGLEPVDPSDGPRVRDLAWLAGRWAGESDGMRIEHDWTAPADALMYGQYRGYEDGQLVLFASMTLAGDVDGVRMTGAPAGSPSRIYALTEAGRQAVRFDSRYRDFPATGEFQRSGDRLTVTFRGLDAVGDPRETSVELKLVGEAPQRHEFEAR